MKKERKFYSMTIWLTFFISNLELPIWEESLKVNRADILSRELFSNKVYNAPFKIEDKGIRRQSGISCPLLQ